MKLKIAATDPEYRILAFALSKANNVNVAISLGITTETFSRSHCAKLFATLVTAGAQLDPGESPVMAICSSISIADLQPWTPEKIVELASMGGDESLHLRPTCVALRETEIRRRLARICAQAIQDSKSESPILETIAKASAEILRLGSAGSAQSVRPVSAIVDSALEDLRARIAGTNSNASIAVTGLPVLDNAIEPPRRGDVVVIGGRPSTGKSCLGLQIARIAVEKGHHVAFFTLETSDESPVLRMAQQRAGIGASKIAEAPQDMQEALLREIEALRHFSNLHVIPCDFSIEAISMRARSLAAAKKLDLIVIDYLQLVGLGRLRGDQNREREVAEVSRTIKQLAMQLGAVAIVLSQFSRAADNDDSPPRLTHLRESGAIEQDADRVYLIYQPPTDRHNQPQRPQPGECRTSIDEQIIVAKNRDGEIPAVWVQFNRAATRFLPVN